MEMSRTISAHNVLLNDLSAVEPAEYIAAMSLHVSSVCVITTEHEGHRYGLTATAVSSVCASPPRLLICINKSGSSHDRIVESQRFCVNVLGEDQLAIARRFAGMEGADTPRFGAEDWVPMPTGAPGLPSATAVFDCRMSSVSDHHSHSVIFGDVVGVVTTTGQLPLLYGARNFLRLATEH